MTAQAGEGMPMKDYYEFSKPDPTIKEFEEEFAKVRPEITYDGMTQNSHKLPATVRVRVENEEDDDVSYDLVGMDVDMLPGCGCWGGIVLVVKKVR